MTASEFLDANDELGQYNAELDHYMEEFNHYMEDFNQYYDLQSKRLDQYSAELDSYMAEFNQYYTLQIECLDRYITAQNDDVNTQFERGLAELDINIDRQFEVHRAQLESDMARMYIEDAHQKYAQTAQESADLGVDAFQEHTDMEIPDPYDDVALKDAGEQNNCKPLRLDLLHQ